MIRSTTVAIALVAVSGIALVAQQPPAGTPTQDVAATYRAAIFRTWKGLHDKILAMAKDTQFPDDKLSFKPHPDSRTVLDEFRHVTIALEMTTAQLKGETFDYVARDKADASKPKTRASVVAEMEAAIAASYPVVEKMGDYRLIGWLDHDGEHYGKLVSNYRMVGIVPPVSRK